MYDLKKTYGVKVIEKNVTAGQTVVNEGAALVSVISAAGNETVQLSAGITGEKFSGFSQLDNATITTEVGVESHVVPATGIIQLDKLNLLSTANNLRVVCNSKDSAVGVATYAFIAYAGAPTTAQVAVDYTNGLLKFNAADIASTATIYYRRTVSALEVSQNYYSRSVNNQASAIFGQVGAITHDGQIFTDQYVINYDYSAVATGSLRTAATGLVGVSAAYGDVVGNVIKIPTVADPFLGIAFAVDAD
jgi:hypothetical protein